MPRSLLPRFAAAVVLLWLALPVAGLVSEIAGSSCCTAVRCCCAGKLGCAKKPTGQQMVRACKCDKMPAHSQGRLEAKAFVPLDDGAMLAEARGALDDMPPAIPDPWKLPPEPPPPRNAATTALV
jgi:hypothetical protein